MHYIDNSHYQIEKMSFLTVADRGKSILLLQPWVTGGGFILKEALKVLIVKTDKVLI